MIMFSLFQLLWLQWGGDLSLLITPSPQWALSESLGFHKWDTNTISVRIYILHDGTEVHLFQYADSKQTNTALLSTSDIHANQQTK